MKKKRLLALGLVLMLALTACSTPKTSESSETPNQTSETPSQSTETPDTVIPSETDVPDVPEVNVNQEGRYKTMTNMVDMLKKEAPDGNVFISDYSINMALSMLLEGSSGDTQKALEDYLGVTKEENAMYNKALIDRAKEAEDTIVKVANSLWVNTGIEPNKDYVKRLEENFDATMDELDFTDPKTADKINDWCAEHTNDLIPTIVDSDTLLNMEAFLANAIYFKGEWIDEFQEYANEDMTFHGRDGDTTVTMMHSMEGTYLENDKVTGFMKSYYDGYKFIGLLPKEEGDFNFSDINIKEVLDSRTHEYDVRIGLPKFKLEYSTILNDCLSALGLNQIFDPSAEFPEISDELKVSSVIHKTYISVDEKGTEAAAVTGITMNNAAMPIEKEIKEVILDRPFAFMIIDSSDNVIFSGIISNLEK